MTCLPAMFLRNLHRGAIVKASGRIFVLGVVKCLLLISTIVAARTLSPTDLTQFFVITSAIAIGSVFAGFGIDQYWIRAQAVHMSGSISIGLRSLAPLAIASSLIGAGIFTAIVVSFGILQYKVSPLLLAGLIASIVAGFVRRLAQNVLLVAGRRALSVVLGAGLFYILIIIGNVFRIAPITEVIVWSSIVSGILAYVAIFYEVRGSTQELAPGEDAFKVSRKVAGLLKESFPSFLNQLGGVVLQRSDVFIIATLASAQEVNQYSIALRLTFVLSLVPEMMVLLLGRATVDAAVQADPQRRSQFIKRVWLVTFTLCAPITLILAIWGEDVLSAVFGAEHRNAYIPLLILLVGKTISSTVGISPVFFTATGHSRQIAKGMLSSVLSFIVLSLTLTGIWGVNGLAIATSLALCVIGANSLVLLKLLAGREKSP